MSIGLTEIEDALRDWVMAQVGLAAGVNPWANDAIHWKPNAPRPTAPYVAIHIPIITRLGRDYFGAPNNTTGIREVFGPRPFTVMLQFFGEGAMSAGEDLRSSLQLETVRDALRAGGAIHNTDEAVTDVSALMETEIEERASFDVRFTATSVQTENTGIIETTEVGVTIKDQAGATVHTDTWPIGE